MTVAVYILFFYWGANGYARNLCECIHSHLCIKQGGNLKAWNAETQHLFVFLELAFISVAVLRWLSSASVCMCLWNRKKGCRKQSWMTRCLEGSLSSFDFWIPLLTMSTIGNAVLEGHIGDLTRIACIGNVQNIPILLSCESFSTRLATNKTLRVPQIRARVIKHGNYSRFFKSYLAVAWHLPSKMWRTRIWRHTSKHLHK